MSVWRRWPWLIVAAAVAAPLALTVLWTGLNHDVRRTLGALRVSESPGIDVFVQRPLAHRMIMAALEAVLPGGWLLSDAVARAVMVVFVLVAALLLYRGLKVWLPRTEAAAVAGAVGVALALAPSWDFLQPDWVACVLAVAGTGVALAARRLPVAAIAGGGLLAVAALQKYVTLSVAAIALIVIFVLDRRRAAAVFGGCAVVGIVGFGLTMWLAPREWQWFVEMPAFNPATPLRGGGIGAGLRLLLEALANESVVAPLLALAPASLVLLIRVAGGRTGRVWVGWSVVVCGIAIAPAFVQAQGFLYHLAPLPVLAAALWALATVRWASTAGERNWLVVLGLPTALIGAAAAIALGAPLPWRLAHNTLVLGGMAAAALVALLWASLVPRSAGPASTAGQPRWWLPVAALIALIAIVVPAWPHSGYAVDGYSGGYTNLAAHEYTQLRSDAYNPVRSQIGARTPVAYLTFGDDAYLLGNPTNCGYPQPSWLLVGKALLPKLRVQRGYQHSVDCLLEPTAKYLVTYPGFIDTLEPELAGRVRQRFDCDQSIPALNLYLCPRR